MFVARLLVVSLVAAPLVALAQTAPAPVPAPAAATPPAAAEAADPIVARINDQVIRRSQVMEAARALPAEYRNMPQQMLFPMLLDQVIDRQALLLVAYKDKLDQDPAVQAQIAHARDQVLENAVLSRDIGPLVSEDAVRARYTKDIAGKPGEEEVHARHILVATEQEAKDLIAQLKGGAEFAALAKTHSTDPGSAQGGDLGFFKKADMLPEFSAAAFALQPGQISETPVKTQYGWHVIKVEERRTAPPEPFEQAHDSLRQKIIEEGMQKVLASARSGVTITRYNPDGSPVRPTDAAEPPPAPAKK